MEQQVYKGRQRFAARQYVKEREFWLNKLALPPVRSHFPYDYYLQPHRDKTFASVSCHLDERLVAGLLGESGQSNYKLHVLLMAVLVLLIRKYTDNEDILVATPIYRPKTSGNFINTLLPIRIRVTDDMTFREVLQRLGQGVIEASSHQNYPMEILFEELQRPLSVTAYPLIDVAILVTNIHEQHHIQPLNPNLTFSFSAAGDTVEAELKYNPNLYARSSIERTACHFLRLLDQAIDKIDAPVYELDILPENERNQLLWDFNREITAAPQTGTIHGLFSRQVIESPYRLAAACKDRFLSYGEVFERCKPAAKELRAREVCPDTIVGLMADTSLEMVVGILTILEAGGAYLPLSPDDSPTKMARMVEDNQIKTLLCTSYFDCLGSEIFSGLPPGSIIFLDKESIDPGDSNQPDDKVKPHNLACILYKSSAAGEPRGVMWEHRNIINLIGGFKTGIFVGIPSGARVALLTGFVSYMSLKQIFGALLLGHCLCILPQDMELDGVQLLEFFNRNRIDVTDAVPFHLRLLSEAAKSAPSSFYLSHVLVDGGVPSPQVVKDFLSRFGANAPSITTIYNIAGCGEALAACHLADHHIDGRRYFPPGKPIAGRTVYIHNARGELQPVGVPGELLIAGSGVCRGYLGDPQLTREKYAEVPAWSTGRFLKTGDSARWLSDGSLELTGRGEEWFEIEQLLRQQEGILEVTVVTGEDEDGKPDVCAYIVATHDIDEEGLKANLASQLQGVKLPDRYLRFEKLPLTAEFEIDRQALLDFDKAMGQYIGPRDPVEDQLASIWADVLEREKETISIDANFFELNGNSLRSIMLISRIFKEFDIRIPLAKIFEAPTIMKLAEYIKGSTESEDVVIQPVEVREYYPLSSGQKRIYILHQLEPDSANYNVPIVETLEFDLDKHKLTDVFRQMVHRHESFRTYFCMVKNVPVQRIYNSGDVDFDIEYTDLFSDATAENGEALVQEIIDDFIKPFDLSLPPLMRVGLIRVARIRYILILDMHHIITDAASRSIFVKEFLALYRGEDLQPMRLQYKDYSVWQNREKVSGALKRQEEYWLDEYKGDLPVLNLPLDTARPLVRSSQGNFFNFEVGAEQIAVLNRIAGEENTTLSMVLLAAFYILLGKICGQEDIVVGTLENGRRHPHLEPIIGMFVNLLPQRNFPAEEKIFTEFLQEVKKRRLEAFENQEYPFEDLLDLLPLNRDMGRNPLVEIIFDYIPIGDQGGQNEVEKGEVNLKQYGYISRTTKYDIILTVHDYNKALYFSFNFSTTIFKSETIRRFAGYFKEIVSAICETKEIKIRDIKTAFDVMALKPTRPVIEFGL